MSYLVLARKWRPKTFGDVVGQAHVVRALKNALSTGRVHHAYLFAGTRGVGKTTLARILAKALNCLEGVAEEPCGQCDACKAVDDGRFVDLIEVDAASRTGVDDTRELLDNVQYTPASGRYKVYLIDEVHMLSKQSFNALLKTLEEPPPHVKFLFATTDPQKLPITVLSRCLQFNLKRLPASLIQDRMRLICEAEKLEAEPAALARLARAAAGSVRDALSLLDQALAFGNDRLGEADVAEMLGSMDQGRVLALLDAVAGGDAQALLAKVRELDEDVPDYERVLDELATGLQQIAVLQVAGEEALEDVDELPVLRALAAAIAPEQAQLFYQIAITSRRDLGLAPDPRLGFEMALLRMLAFRPDTEAALSNPGASASRTAVAPPPRAAAGARQPGKPAAVDKPASVAPLRKIASPADISDWPAFVASLPVRGAARQLAENCALKSATDRDIQLRIEHRNGHLVTDNLSERLSEVISEYFGSRVRLMFEVAEKAGQTAAARASAAAEQERQQARQSIEQDPKVQQLVDMFGAEIVEDSIRPASDKDA